MNAGEKHVLVTGGSGYTGQFVTQHFASLGFKVVYTHYSTAAPYAAGDNVDAKWVNLVTGEGLSECFRDGRQYAAVINTAAMSQPALCERDPVTARSINVPKALISALRQHYTEPETQPVIIHFSTDQVYDGSKAWWKEDDPCQPVNAYAASKLEGERYVQAEWPKHVILRASIIIGPQSPVPVSRPLFLQFIVQQLAEQKETTFFTDEFRNPTYVRDIVHILAKLIAGEKRLHGRTYNMGGPDRLSRLEMAQTVAEICGYSSEFIIAAPSSTVQRPVRSPPDISMDSSRIETDLDMKLTTFRAAVKQMHEAGELERPPPKADGA